MVSILIDTINHLIHPYHFQLNLFGVISILCFIYLEIGENDKIITQQVVSHLQEKTNMFIIIYY
jgi:hypothetical protein